MDINGATSASYTTPPATSGDNGAAFRCVVSNAAGSATSGQAILTVITPPAITQQPVNDTVNVGQTATFTVVASGSSSALVSMEEKRSEYRRCNLCVIHNACGNFRRQWCCIPLRGLQRRRLCNQCTGNPDRHQPTGDYTTTCERYSRTSVRRRHSAVAASGTAPLSYQWQKNGVNISGATSASYTTPAATSGDNGATFRCMVSNAAGSATSAQAILTVTVAIIPPAITQQPVSDTVNVGQTATFTVVASGTAPLSYQWQKNGSNIGGATSASYTTPPAISGDNGATFRCRVSNSAGSVTSTSAILTVIIPPAITQQPVNDTVNVGQTSTFTVVASGSAPLSYQWKKNGSNISGATSASYTTPTTISGDNGATFRCVVSNAARDPQRGTGNSDCY